MEYLNDAYLFVLIPINLQECVIFCFKFATTAFAMIMKTRGIL